MKAKIKILLITMVGIFLSAGILTSCKDDNSPELPYLFRPINFKVELNKTVATLSWARVDSAVSYTLQLSKDSLFATLVTDTTMTGQNFIQELAGETKFFARVRANAQDTTKNSKFNNTLSFSTPKENLFTGFGISNNTGTLYPAYMTDANTLTLTWTPNANVTHVILKLGDVRDSVAVSADEKVAGKKVVAGLANGKWSIAVMNNQVQRGTTTGLVEGDIVLHAGDNLQSALGAATEGQVILLAGDASYTIGSGLVALKAIKLRGLSTTNRPVISMSTGATSTATMFSFGVGTGAIQMENIEFTGYCENNTANTKIGYMFNNSIASATVSKLSFVNCKLHNFGNTPFRLQGTKSQSVDTLLLNGCVVNEIGFTSTYAIVNSNTNDLFKNIIFSNSTFYNFKGSLILRTGAFAVNSVRISNCVINQATQDVGSARYMFDFNTAVFASSDAFSIRNTIFGSSGGALGSNGYRGTATLAVSGSYYTSDYVDAPVIPPADGSSTSFKSKMNAYSGTSTALWTSPATGDFTLKDTNFAGKGTAGDLRWY